MVSCRGRVHLREDRRHITEDSGIEKRADEHHDTGEDLFIITVGSNIAEANAGQRTHCVIECADISCFSASTIGLVGADVAE